MHAKPVGVVARPAGLAPPAVISQAGHQPALALCQRVRVFRQDAGAERPADDVPVAPLFGQAILNIANGTSVSSLFDSITLEPIYEAFYPTAA